MKGISSNVFRSNRCVLNLKNALLQHYRLYHFRNNYRINLELKCHSGDKSIVNRLRINAPNLQFQN